MGKVDLRLQVDAELVARARENGVELASALEDALRQALAGQPRPAAVDEAARAKAWAEENAEAIAAHRERIEKYGVFGEDLRTW